MRRTITMALAVVLLALGVETAGACQCAVNTGFLETVVRSDLVVRGKIVAYGPNLGGRPDEYESVKVRIRKTLVGSAGTLEIVIHGGNGMNCTPRIFSKFFVRGDEYFFAVDALEDGDYTLPGCAQSWRRIEGGVVRSPYPTPDGEAPDGLPVKDTEKAVAFVKEMDAMREAAQVPGLSVAVVKDGRVFLVAGMGLMNLEHPWPALSDTPYNIASVTKPLSAVVAMKLVEMGLLDLDRPLAEYTDWDEFCREFSEQASIFARDLVCDPLVHTLRQLLSHTATGTPGTHFSYNPVLYSWASRPIMAVADTSFSSLVERYVFAPAGMTRSARMYRDLPLPREIAFFLAQPYHVDSLGVLVPSDPPPPQGDGAAGGVITSVADLAKFDIALDQGKLISPRSRAAMMTPTKSPSGEDLPYGLGWFVEDYDGHRLVWHSGWWENAYSALYLKVPELNLTFIVSANSDGVWWDNPLDRAEVERSEFARAFLRAFVKD